MDFMIKRIVAITTMMITSAEAKTVEMIMTFTAESWGSGCDFRVGSGVNSGSVVSSGSGVNSGSVVSSGSAVG